MHYAENDTLGTFKVRRYRFDSITKDSKRCIKQAIRQAGEVQVPTRPTVLSQH